MDDPIIIIGAPRSGTNMLRNALCQVAGFVTWPCDEINSVWRYGNARQENDELGASSANKTVKKYIHQAFDKLVLRSRGDRVIEKTCANSLRLDFVNEIFPKAQYIFITRDGRDVFPSAMKRWESPFDLSYSLRKARYIPTRDLPAYAARYCSYRAKRMWSRQKHLSSWGPRFKGIDEYVRAHKLSEICAKQWAVCVEKSISSFQKINSSCIYSVRYEDFVESPAHYMHEIMRFLDRQTSEIEITKSIQNVMRSSVGKGKLSPFYIDQKVEGILEPMLNRCGYLNTAPLLSKNL